MQMVRLKLCVGQNNLLGQCREHSTVHLVQSFKQHQHFHQPYSLQIKTKYHPLLPRILATWLYSKHLSNHPFFHQWLYYSLYKLCKYDCNLFQELNPYSREINTNWEDSFNHYLNCWIITQGKSIQIAWKQFQSLSQKLNCSTMEVNINGMKTPFHPLSQQFKEGW